ncbi:ABC transporter ATP-binding protein [Actinobacillus equuli]|uniref:ABC transporter ATP-binding protein n=2 Tax=Actinobacillus TaxID=713 RepID=A0A9X4G4L7_ACTEU|nr:ABC transporter ATP-binding protein [Actinobacillus equuli]MDE8035071.1 ABC transporter ATP-binding protein [Actinobacillus equuli subsp. equuli]MDG4948490.1 ABC transporter ATP-binding protein [Actinobacillus equuli subsp. haemolyticus]WGE42817.1 ABC transporter ATP-binding protein [Actinobacillus equuli subsp. haemolyticus]WGE47191.1 ABC transporter ATP-binding protein [Actinobacillus equuli subsp. haemolyticus]WGE70592.1 ABC transporter ATP-binding protein [Actinobacillus equuli subsp. h
MNCIEIHQLHFAFKQQVIFNNFDFVLPKGKWCALLGASGIGKSTLLRLIAGLETTLSGSVELAPNTQIAWFAQQDSLFPWLSVLDNVQLAAHLHGNKNAETLAKAEQLLASVKMSEHKNKPCYQLSGGQRQRVALARTLMQDADLILMDEPFSALDAVTRLQLQQLAAQLLANKTVLLITHDPQEAIRLADQIYILKHQPAQLSNVIEPSSKAPRFNSGSEQWQLEQQLLAMLSNPFMEDENV